MHCRTEAPKISHESDEDEPFWLELCHYFDGVFPMANPESGKALTRARAISLPCGMMFSISIPVMEKILLLSGVFFVANVVEAQTPVNFPDANLVVRIREAIEKPTGAIYDTDLQTITILNANNSEISDLTGLEYCINITELSLNNNQIDDIGALACLTSLQDVPS